jgi:DNA polymerase-3 subunit gamma/tau
VSYQVFARKYRPQNFDSVIGQEHITQTLKNAIEQNRLAHAYLFVGPRGTGKTSTARILAKALNCVNGPTVNPCGVCDVCREIAQGNSLDVLEIDGASNNGVEQVRELRENVRFAPTRGKYKIYIIDEVHMLTSAAFNALLKTLEEPPEHVKFVFATTEPQKVLPTILSRCQRFDLRRIPAPLISKHLQHIAGEEKFLLDEAAAQAIAKGAEGGLRDAESMLDQLVAFCGDKITEQDVLSIFGFTAQQTVSNLCGLILEGDSPQALGMVHAQAESGKDLSRLMSDLISHLRDLLVAKADPDGVKEELGEEALTALKSQTEKITMDRLLELIEQFAAAETRMKWAPNKKLHFEIAVIKAIQTLGQTTLTEIIDTLAVLRGGGDPKLPQPRQPVPAARPLPAKGPEPAPVRRKISIELDPKPTEPVAPPAPVAEKNIVHEEPAKPAPVSTENFWPTLLSEVRAKRPLISSWIETGTLLGIEGDHCLIGFPKDKTLSIDSLTRPSNKKFIEELITSLAGRPLTLKFEVRDGLVVEPQVIPEKKIEPPPDPVSEFKNDPLIQKALEIFRAEIQPV